MSNFAWVTLATNDSYSLGALVLAHSLKRAGTAHQLAVLITPGVSNAMRERLQNVFNVVEEVNVLDSQDSANLALLARPELGITFTKLHCWRLVQFDKCVFLDADTMVLQNSDELFEREELSAAPDVGWPDCFNSGVFVYKPSMDTYGKLLDFAVKQGSFDGGDQGLLNLFFSDWAHRDIAKHLPFIYNTCSTACYSYLPAFKQFGKNVKILHFIGAMKPWLQSFDSKSGQVHCPSGSQHVAQYLQFWWTIFFQNVHRDLSAEMKTSLVPSTINQLLQSITLRDDLFVNNPANLNTSCNKDNEPFKYVDPWDTYQSTTSTTTISGQETEDDPQQSVVTESPTRNVLQRVVDVFTGDSSRQNCTPGDAGPTFHTPFTTSHTTSPPSPQKSSDHNTDRDDRRHPQQPPPDAHCQQYSTTANSPKRTNESMDQRPQQHKDQSPLPQETVEDESSGEAGIAGALSHITLGSGKSAEQEAYEHQMRRQFWEAGNIDYMGKDSFENIWARISKTIDSPAETSPAPAEAAAPSTPAAAAPVTKAPSPPADKKSPTAPVVNETVEEEKVKIQERVITTKTPDGKTVLTKITTLPGEEIEEIEEETTETIDGETKTNKTKSQVVKAPFPVSKLPNGKEIPIKPNMKEGETSTEYDEETKTTVVTKRLANGYEQTFSTITPEGNNKSWTKTFFDPVPVEGDEEEEEIEEYEEVETSASTKKTTTSTEQTPGVAGKKPASGAAPAGKPEIKTTTTSTTVPQPSKPKAKPSEHKVVQNIPHGKKEITTTVDKDGKETTKIHTMMDLPDQAEEYEEYEETHITEEQPKTKKTTTTTTAATPGKKQQVVPAGKNTTTTVAVPSAQNPKDNVLARKVVTKGEEEIQITEEHTETEFSPTKKKTVTSSVVPSTGEKLDPKGKTTVNKVVIPGSQSTVVTKSNEQDGKQIVVKKGPSGTQNISKTTSPDGSSKVQVTTTVNPEELHIEETETTNIIGDKTITTTRTEVPIPGKKIVTKIPAQKVEGAGTKTKTTTTTTIDPVGVDRKTTTTKRVDNNGTEVAVKTETKDGKTRLETRTKFDPIFHPAVSDEEEIEEFEEETQTFAPVKTKTTTTSRVPAAEATKKKPDAASSETATPVAPPRKNVKGNQK